MRGRANTWAYSKDNMANKAMPEGKCGWCNQNGHGRRPNRETREVKCKAFLATCLKCHKVGQFKSYCRSKAEGGTQNSITPVGKLQIPSQRCQKLFDQRLCQTLRKVPGCHQGLPQTQGNHRSSQVVRNHESVQLCFHPVQHNTAIQELTEAH